MKRISIKILRGKSSVSALCLWPSEHQYLSEGTGDHDAKTYLKNNRERIADNLDICPKHMHWQVKLQSIRNPKKYDAPVMLDSICYPLVDPSQARLSLKVSQKSCNLCEIDEFGHDTNIGRKKNKKKKRTKKKRTKSDRDASDTERDNDSTDSDEYDARKDPKNSKNKNKKSNDARVNSKLWARYIQHATKKFKAQLSPEGICVLAKRHIDMSGGDASFDIDMDVVPADILSEYPAKCRDMSPNARYKTQRTTHYNYQQQQHNPRSYSPPRHGGYASSHHSNTNSSEHRYSPYYQPQKNVSKRYQYPPYRKQYYDDEQHIAGDNTMDHDQMEHHYERPVGYVPQPLVVNTQTEEMPSPNSSPSTH